MYIAASSSVSDAQALGIRMLRERVQVDDAEEVLELVLVASPVAQRAEVVAEMQAEVRLNAAQDARARGDGVRHWAQSLPSGGATALAAGFRHRTRRPACRRRTR